MAEIYSLWLNSYGTRKKASAHRRDFNRSLGPRHLCSAGLVGLLCRDRHLFLREIPTRDQVSRHLQMYEIHGDRGLSFFYVTKCPELRILAFEEGKCLRREVCPTEYMSKQQTFKPLNNSILRSPTIALETPNKYIASSQPMDWLNFWWFFSGQK